LVNLKKETGRSELGKEAMQAIYDPKFDLILRNSGGSQVKLSPVRSGSEVQTRNQHSVMPDGITMNSKIRKITTKLKADKQKIEEKEKNKIREQVKELRKEEYRKERKRLEDIGLLKK